MSFGALLFFFLFITVIVFTYIALRRRLAPPMMLSAGCVIGSMLTMGAFALAQGSVLLHAVLVGLLVGGAFSVATLAVAMYFQGNEIRQGMSK